VKALSTIFTRSPFAMRQPHPEAGIDTTTVVTLFVVTLSSPEAGDKVMV
jgi:hypothetical protein